MKLEEVKKAFKTLIWSGGAEAPREAVWAANEFMAIFMKNKGTITDIIELDEMSENYEEFINQLEKTWT